MIGPELPNLSSIVDRARSCPPATLLEVFIGLVSVTLPYIAHDRDCTAAYKNHVIASLSKLPSRSPTLPTLKAKQPPTPRTKKKPPPKKAAAKHVTTLSKRYALFWNPTIGNPPRADEANKLENVPDHLYEASNVFQVQIPDLTGWNSLGQSVFEPHLLDEQERDVIRSATNTETLDSWFERQRKEVITSPKIIAKSDGARQSVLGISMAQRISILIHSLRKSISPKATVKDVKEAILSCSLGKEELTLILDIIPNEDDMGSQRRMEQWRECDNNIQELVSKDSTVILTEDEEFLYFLMRLPNPTRRLQCMFIIPAFRHIVSEMERKLHWMTDALDILLRNRRIILCWHMLLHVGNLLNEGTARSNQTWFTTSALRRALDVRGNKGMTLPEYLAAFIGPVLTPTEWRALQKAKDGGPLSTYVAAKDVLDTFVSILRPANDPKTMMPEPLRDTKVLDGSQDLIVEKMKQFTDVSFPTAQRLLRTFLKFIQMYAAAAYYFGDPHSLLPLERGVEGDVDNEDSPAKDLFTRVATFIGTLRAKADSDRVHSDLCAAPLPCSPRPLATPRTSRSTSPPTSPIKDAPKAVAPVPKLIKRLTARNIKSPSASGDENAATNIVRDPRRFLPVPDSDGEVKLPVRSLPISATPIPPRASRTAEQPSNSDQLTTLTEAPSLVLIPSSSVDAESLPTRSTKPTDLASENQPPPPSSARPPINRFRFGFRPGGRLQTNEPKLDRGDSLHTTPANATDDTITSPDGVSILAPRMPQQKRRRPRSSIEATFALARDVAR